MTINELLQEIITATQWPDMVSFFGGVKSEHNLMQDNRKFPAVLLIEPVTTSDEMKLYGVIEVTYDLMLLFCAKSELDWPQEEHDKNCIVPMRQLSRKFLLAASNNKKIKAMKNARRTNFINLFDVQMSGVVLTMSITPQNDEDLCL